MLRTQILEVCSLVVRLVSVPDLGSVDKPLRHSFLLLPRMSWMNDNHLFITFSYFPQIF